MRGNVILGGLILLFGTACQGAKVTDTPDWPRVSLEARLLSVPQVFVDEFALVFELDDEQSSGSGTIHELEYDLLLNAIQNHEHIMSLTAPRVVASNGRLIGVTYDFPRGFEFVGSDGYADSDFEVGWRKVELGLACDPFVAEATGCANLRVDVRFVGHLKSQNRTYKPLALDLWSEGTKNLSAPAGQMWLIGLPHTKIHEAISNPEDDTRRYFLLIRPVLLHSNEHEACVYPAPPEAGVLPG